MFELEQQAYDLGYFAEGESSPLAPAKEAKAKAIVQPGFQLPASIWAAMIACYAVFLGTMFNLASASGFALFMVVISTLYVVVFFATANLLAGLPGRSEPSALDRGRPLPTWCGPMSRNAVMGQVLIVPFGIAFFGVAVALINWLV